ncbi:MAG: hypothetical protein ACHQAX_02690 [Gammaproteobacteria bacterium]
MKSNTELQFIAALPLVPFAVLISRSLEATHYNELLAQLSAVRIACGSHLGIPPQLVTLKIGGIDAYKLITKTYDAPMCAPLEIHVEVSEHLSEKLLDKQKDILESACALNNSLSNINIFFQRIPPISNGQFMIEDITGKVFHPFPDKKHNNSNSKKPPYIDSGIFIYQHKIITPGLAQTIETANLGVSKNTAPTKNEALNVLAFTIKSYFIWIRSGKSLSGEMADIFVAFCNEEKYQALRRDLAKVQELPPGYTFDQLLKDIKLHPKHEEAILKSARKPIQDALDATEAEAGELKNQLLQSQEDHAATQAALAKTTAELERFKGKDTFTSLMHNLTSQQLAQVDEQRKSLKNENAELIKEKSVLEAKLLSTEKSLQASQHTVARHETASNTAEARIAELEAQLAAAKKAAETEKGKNKHLVSENTALIAKAKKSEDETKRIAEKKDAEITALTAKIRTLESGTATLFKKNHALNQKVTALEKSFTELNAPTAKKPVTATTMDIPTPASVPTVTTQPVMEPEASQTDIATTSSSIQPIETSQAILPESTTQPKNSKPALGTEEILVEIKKRLSWYLLKMFSSEDPANFPRFEKIVNEYSETPENEILSDFQHSPILKKAVTNAKTAQNLASNLQMIFAKIRAIPLNSDTAISIEELMLAIDNYIDSAFCATNTFKSTAERMGDFGTTLLLMLDFLRHTQNNAQTITIIEMFTHFLRSEKSDDIASKDAILAKLDRISSIHHHLLKHQTLISRARALFSKFLEDPQTEIDPHLLELPLDFVDFHEKLRHYNDDEFVLSKKRFCQTLAMPSSKQTANISTEQLDNILMIFKQKYRFHVVKETCFPFIQTYFETIAKKPKNKLASKKFLEKVCTTTYVAMIDALKATFPDQPPTIIFENYMYALSRWSAVSTNPKIHHDSPLFREITILLSEDFINNLKKTKTPKEQTDTVYAGISLALVEFTERKIFDIPQREQLVCLAHILAHIDVSATYLNDRIIYRMIHAGLTLGFANAPSPAVTQAPATLTTELTPSELKSMLCTYLSGCLAEQKSSAKVINEIAPFNKSIDRFRCLIQLPSYLNEQKKPGFMDMLKALPTVSTVEQAHDVATLYVSFIQSFHYLSSETVHTDFELQVFELFAALDNTTKTSILPVPERCDQLISFLRQVCDFMDAWNTYQKAYNTDDTVFINTAKKALALLDEKAVKEKLVHKLERVGKLFRFLCDNISIFTNAFKVLEDNNNKSASFNDDERHFYINLSNLIGDSKLNDPAEFCIAQQCFVKHIRLMHPSTTQIKPIHVALVLTVMNAGFSALSEKQVPLPVNVNKDALRLLSTLIEANIKRLHHENPEALNQFMSKNYPEKPDPEHLRKILVLFLIVRIQELDNPKPNQYVEALGHCYEDLGKKLKILELDKSKKGLGESIHELAKLFPLHTTVGDAENLAFFLTQGLHIMASLKGKKGDVLFTDLSNALVDLDNESQHNMESHIYDKIATVRVNYLCDRFRFIMTFLHHASLAQFKNTRHLGVISHDIVTELTNEKNMQPLQWMFTVVGDTHRYLFNHIDTILEALKRLQHQQPFDDKIMKFYESCPKVIQNSDGTSKAEKYFLADIERLAQVSGSSCPSLSSEQWMTLKKALNTTAHKTWSPSDEIKDALAWHIMKSVTDHTCSLEPLRTHYREQALAPKHEKHKEALALLPAEITANINAANIFAADVKMILRYIVNVPSKADIKDTLINFILTMDKDHDSFYCASGKTLPVNQRLASIRSPLGHLLSFLKLTDNHAQHIILIEKLITMMEGTTEENNTTMSLLHAKMEHIGNIHHHFFTHKSVIFALINHSTGMTDPDKIAVITPAMTELNKDEKVFMEGLKFPPSITKEDEKQYIEAYNDAKSRFLNTLLLITQREKNATTQTMSSVELDNALDLLARKQQVTLACETCHPILRTYLGSTITPKKTRNTFESMITALKKASPESDHDVIIFNFIYACRRWTFLSEKHGYKKIPAEHELMSHILPRIPPQTISKLLKAKDAGAERSLILEWFEETLNTLSIFKFLNIPESSKKPVLLSILLSCQPLLKDDGEKAAVHSAILILSGKNHAPNADKTTLEKNHPLENADPTYIRKLLTLYFTTRLNEFTIKTRARVNDFLTEHSELVIILHALTDDELKVVNHLCTFVPLHKNPTEANDCSYLFVQSLHIISSLRDSADIEGKFINELIDIDNNLTRNIDNPDYHLDMGFKRFQAYRERFRLVNTLIQAKRNLESTSPNPLSNVAEKIAGEDGLLFAIGKASKVCHAVCDIGDSHRFLLKHFTVLAATHNNVKKYHTLPQDVLKDALKFMRECPAHIKNMFEQEAQDKISKAETYFIADYNFIRNDKYPQLPLLTTTDWFKLKSTMIVAYRQSNAINTNATAVGSSSVLITYSPAAQPSAGEVPRTGVIRNQLPKNK